MARKKTTKKIVKKTVVKTIPKAKPDLAKAQKTSSPTSDYSAKHIQVLEGLEPVRKRQMQLVFMNH